MYILTLHANSTLLYALYVFLQISCEKCHGEAHFSCVRKAKRARMDAGGGAAVDTTGAG